MGEAAMSDKGPISFTLDIQALLDFMAQESGSFARPVHKWKWRDLHALYTATEPDIGPRRKQRPKRPQSS